MINKLKSPQRDPVKKTSFSRPVKQRQIHVVKHFQPDLIFNKDCSRRELPEVDNDVDVQDYLKKITSQSHRRLLYGGRKPRSSNELYSENQVITKATIITHKKGKCGVQSNTSFKSNSCIERSRSSPLVKNQGIQHLEKSKSFLTKRSKSFSNASKRPERLSNDKNRRKGAVLSSSSSEFNENHVFNLKKEIAQHKCKTAGDTLLDTKTYLKQKHEIHSEKVRHLREEINKIINIDLEDKKRQVTELKTEIAQYRRNDCFAVYNFETRLNSPDNKNIIEEGTRRNDGEEPAGPSFANYVSSTTSASASVSAGRNTDEEVEVELVEREINTSDLSRARLEENEPTTTDNAYTSEDEGDEGVEYDLQLIADVEQNPILYDSNHENFRRVGLKLQIWREITYRLRQSNDEGSVALVKNRWKSLRDALVREMRLEKKLLDSQETEERIPKRPRRWRYANAMSFLIPYIVEAHPNRTNKKSKKATDIETVEPIEKYLVTPEELRHIMNEDNGQDDEIGVFFRDIADTVRKMSPESQAKVQRQIVSLVLDSNLWEIQESRDQSEHT